MHSCVSHPGVKQLSVTEPSALVWMMQGPVGACEGRIGVTGNKGRGETGSDGDEQSEKGETGPGLSILAAVSEHGQDEET